MNILMLSVNFKTWVANTLYFEQMAIMEAAEQRGDRVIMYGPGFRYNNSSVPAILEELDQEGINIDVIVSYISPVDLRKGLPEPIVNHFQLPQSMQLFPKDLEKVTSVPKVFWMNDFWQLNQKRWDAALLGNGFDTVFSVYAPFHITKAVFDNTFSSDVQASVKFYPLPRAIRPDIFKAFEHTERDIDVTQLGAQSAEVYPGRYYFSQTLNHQSDLAVFQKDHPGYNFEKYSGGDSVTGDRYYEVLSRSKMFATCGLKYNLPVIKIYEILASGALLITDRINNADALGLKPGVHYVETTTPDFMPTVKAYLADDELRSSVANAGRELFLSRHTTEQRAGEFLTHLDSVLRDKKQTASTPVNFEAQEDRRWSYRLRKKFKKFAAKKKERGSNPAKVLSQRNNYSKLDWANISHHVYILDSGIVPGKQDVNVFQKYCLNTSYGRQDPFAENTEHAELAVFKPALLTKLLEVADAKICLDIGTGRGMNALVCAEYLDRAGQSDGMVLTCDAIHYEKPHYAIPGEGSKVFTRKELFANVDDQVLQKIGFITGDASVLVKQLKSTDKFANFAYFNCKSSYEDTLTQLLVCHEHLEPNALFALDNVDVAHPEMESAVTTFLQQNDLKACAVSFSPSHYRMVVAGKQQVIDKVAEHLNAISFERQSIDTLVSA